MLCCSCAFTLATSSHETYGLLTEALPSKDLPSMAMFLDALRSASRLNPHLEQEKRFPCLKDLSVVAQTEQV